MANEAILIAVTVHGMHIRFPGNDGIRRQSRLCGSHTDRLSCAETGHSWSGVELTALDPYLSLRAVAIIATKLRGPYM
jgi:hypothetical protein